jgi:hypothetical protein
MSLELAASTSIHPQQLIRSDPECYRAIQQFSTTFVWNNIYQGIPLNANDIISRAQLEFVLEHVEQLSCVDFFSSGTPLDDLSSSGVLLQLYCPLAHSACPKFFAGSSYTTEQS